MDALLSLIACEQLQQSGGIDTERFVDTRGRPMVGEKPVTEVVDYVRKFFINDNDSTPTCALV